MQHLLRVGQVFRCAKFCDLIHPLLCDSEEVFIIPPQANRSKLVFDSSKRTTCVWTEHGANGWKRERNDVIDLTPADANNLAFIEFEVLETRMTGGGCGHGPHDVFPNGHEVVAREVDGERLVRFFQSGCFIGMCPPCDIELVRGPKDVPEVGSPGVKSVWETS
jgi:hypothetical protein